MPNGYTLKRSRPYWSNLSFLIIDIRALGRSILSARAPKCQKLKMVGGLDHYGPERFDGLILPQPENVGMKD